MSKITVELEPQESKSIVVVCKAPQFLKPLNLLSVLKVTQGKSYTVKNLETGRRKSQEDYIEVLLAGRLENPGVFCTKAIVEQTSKQCVIPLAVRTDQ